MYYIIYLLSAIAIISSIYYIISILPFTDKLIKILYPEMEE